MKRKSSKYGAPNKALSPYNYFYKDKVSLYKKVDSKTFFEFMKEISSEYNNLSSEEKQKYINLAKNDKNRYDQDMKEFQKTSNYKHYLKDLNAKSKVNMTDNKKTDLKKSDSKKIVNKKPKLDKKDSEILHKSEIRIFTREFLEHNQQREELLRSIKKQVL